MNLNELKEKLEFLYAPNNEIGLVMFLILSTDNGFVVRKANIRAEARQALKAQFLEYIQHEIIDNDELYVGDLSHADGRANAIYNFDFEDLPDGLEVLGELLEEEEAEEFHFGRDDFEQIYGYVFLLGNEENTIALYKKQYPISLLRRASAVMFWNSNRQLTLVPEDIIKIEPAFQFLQIGDEFLVLNTKTLEQFFSFDEVIKNRAVANIAMIQRSNFVHDITALTDMVNNLRFAKKLMRLKATSPVLLLEFNKVSAFIKQHPKLRKRIRFHAGNGLISLDTQVSKELFIKLLDDDFLKSDLTDFLYDADKKDVLTNEEEED